MILKQHNTANTFHDISQNNNVPELYMRVSSPVSVNNISLFPLCQYNDNVKHKTLLTVIVTQKCVIVTSQGRIHQLLCITQYGFTCCLCIVHGTLHVPNVHRVLGNESRRTGEKETLSADVINSLSDKDMNRGYGLWHIPTDWSHSADLPEETVPMSSRPHMSREVQQTATHKTRSHQILRSNLIRCMLAT